MAPKLKTSSLKASSPLKRKRKESPSGDKFWHPALDDPPPPNFTPGELSVSQHLSYCTDCVIELVPLLKKALMKAHAKGTVEKAYLCSDVAVHVHTESFDRGWGCG